MKTIQAITFFIVVMVFMKSLLVGSDFSFHYWFKYGDKYKKWYFSRPKFNPDLPPTKEE